MNKTTVAQQAKTASFLPSAQGILQRKCACGSHTMAGGECAECSKKKQALQRKAVDRSEVSEVPPIVHEVLRSPGQPLDSGARAFMEPRFGHDFSQVQVHTDAKAAESAQAVNALAYTVGRDVVFGKGRYAPESVQGRRLLAHELTHVAQQNQGLQNVGAHIATESEQSISEREADTIAERVVKGENVKPTPNRLKQFIQFQRGGGSPAAAEHRFSAEGVSIVVRRSCAPEDFGFATVETGVRDALDQIFNSECIEESRRTRIQRNLTAHGLDIRCRRSANLETPGSCAESTGFFIPANIFTLGSSSFSDHPDSSADCQPIESTILHEIVHLTRGFAQESLPSSCEASCFGAGGGDPTLCRDIDVFGKRRAT